MFTYQNSAAQLREIFNVCPIIIGEAGEKINPLPPIFELFTALPFFTNRTGVVEITRHV
jgi:hypothetical protein